jgi:hypothetical protein
VRRSGLHGLQRVDGDSPLGAAALRFHSRQGESAESGAGSVEKPAARKIRRGRHRHCVIVASGFRDRQAKRF